MLLAGFVARALPAEALITQPRPAAVVFSTEERWAGFLLASCPAARTTRPEPPWHDACRMAPPARPQHIAQSYLLYITLGGRAANRSADCSARILRMQSAIRAYATRIIQFGNKMYFLGDQKTKNGALSSIWAGHTTPCSETKQKG